MKVYLYFKEFARSQNELWAVNYV